MDRLAQSEISRKIAAEDTFSIIRRAFPELEMNLEKNNGEVELLLDIPAQQGLRFDISLYLDNVDELVLTAESFRNSWFPCSDPQVTRSFVDAVKGLIAGDLRILEHVRGDQVVRADLQFNSSGRWETLSRWSTLSFPWPRKTYRVVQNEQSHPPVQSAES